MVFMVQNGRPPGQKPSQGPPAIYNKILPYINSNNPGIRNMTVFYKKFLIYALKFLFEGNAE